VKSATSAAKQLLKTKVEKMIDVEEGGRVTGCFV
jgi:hypothetical protein